MLHVRTILMHSHLCCACARGSPTLPPPHHQNPFTSAPQQPPPTSVVLLYACATQPLCPPVKIPNNAATHANERITDEGDDFAVRWLRCAGDATVVLDVAGGGGKGRRCALLASLFAPVLLGGPRPARLPKRKRRERKKKTRVGSSLNKIPLSLSLPRSGQ